MPEPGVLLITSARTDAHVAPGHPERPERRAAVAAGVRRAATDGGVPLGEREARLATDEELQRVHPAALIEALDASVARGGGWIDADTYVVPGSGDALRLAAGGTIDAALAVADGLAHVAFAVVRPPGHHASAQQPSGFCLVNNVALAVSALRAGGRAWRVAIVDWDVHHGDGTQALFESDPDVCYASTHQMPLFPGTGAPDETGLGAGRGTMHNAPLAPGSDDPAFVAAWRERLLPAIEAFAPEAILVSAGYDAHAVDPLAELEVTEAGFEAVAREVGAVAARLGLPGVALTLEGGYDLDAIRDSAAATVRGLLAGLRTGSHVEGVEG
ncbi:MAG: histone deacetylase [Chloroflexota bacterium]